MTKDEALKLALEALEHEADKGNDDAYKVERDAIKEALAQPEQEPVAWMFQHEETGRMMFVEAQQLEWGFEKGNPRLKKIRPLYTTPPQRTWVGLTEDEAFACQGRDYFETYKAIEAKLKERNT